MKKTLLSLALGFITFGLTAQCDFPTGTVGVYENVSTGEGTGSGVPVAPVTCTVNTGTGINDLEVTEFSIAPEPGYAFSLIVSEPYVDTEGNEENLIIGATSDGKFDFSNDEATGAPFAPNTYSFTAFVYDQAALDEVTALAVSNPITSGLGFVGGETLEDIVTIVRTNPVVELLNGGPVTIEDFLFNILPLIATTLNTESLCVDWATGDEVYSIEVYDSEDDCSVVAIEDITKNNTLGIYPNPASTLTNVNFDSDVNGEINISLFDLTGKLVLSENNFVNAGENTIPVSTDDLHSGVYLLQVNAGSASITKRLTISK